MNNIRFLMVLAVVVGLLQTGSAAASMLKFNTFGNVQFCTLRFFDEQNNLVGDSALTRGQYEVETPAGAVKFAVTYDNPQSPADRWRDETSLVDTKETPAFKVVCNPLGQAVGRHGGVIHLV